MFMRLVLCLAVVVVSLPAVVVPAAAQQTLSPSQIECALDPTCPKPQQHKRGLQRGVVVEGGGEPRPLSVNLYVNFEFNSAELTSDARNTLDQLGTALRDPKLAAYSFVIAGHTDAVGGAEFNQKLSERVRKQYATT